MTNETTSTEGSSQQNPSNTESKNQLSNFKKSLWIIALFLFLEFIYLIYSDNLSILPLVYIITICLFLLGLIITASNRNLLDREKAISELRNQYSSIREQINIPETAREINCFKSNLISQNKVLIWKKNNDILLFPSPPVDLSSITINEIILNIIPVNQIEYFTKNGGIVRLKYLDDKNRIISLFFDLNAFQVFYDLMPEKEIDFVPNNAREINFYKSSSDTLNSRIKLGTYHKVFIWKKEDSIFLFPSYKESNISPLKIQLNILPINQIEYFSKIGEVFRENKITGGGGGGSSIGGAVAGGLIAGDVGAVIGSRKKVNEIKSELITHDTRETCLNYFEGNERYSLYFDIDAFQKFNDLIPEKEFSIVNSIKSSEIIKNKISISGQKSATDQIRELAKLRDDGIITENEFGEKKKQLLDKIS